MDASIHLLGPSLYRTLGQVNTGCSGEKDVARNMICRVLISALTTNLPPITINLAGHRSRQPTDDGSMPS